LPVRFELTPGQWADSPQAERLIAGLEGVGHVVADSGYDTEALRSVIAETMQAEAHIKRNRSRARCCHIDWTIYKERHLVESFFNRIKRFRRITLRVEKTLSAFKAFVSIACAMAWLA
ncbi:transposase, partial [Paracoccus pacificus]